MNSISSAGAQGISNYQSSQETRVLHNSDKYEVSQHGQDNFSVFDKQSGQSHHASGDFGQSELSGADNNLMGGMCRPDASNKNDLISKIVEKILEKLGEALGIDLTGAGEQQPQPPAHDHGDGTCRGGFPAIDPWRFPSSGFDPRMIEMNSGGQSAPAAGNQRPLTETSMPGDILGLGNQQNVKDHNGIERAFDPFGIF